MKPIRHAPDCGDPSQLRVVNGGRGDRLERCQTCMRFRVLESTEREKRPRVPAFPVVGTYTPHAQRVTHVCRDHHHPVNWKGDGCPDCSAVLRMTKDERAATRRKEEHEGKGRLHL